jgi:hypothetical protein
MLRSICVLVLAGAIVGCVEPNYGANGGSDLSYSDKLRDPKELAKISLRCSGVLGRAAEHGRAGGTDANAVWVAANGRDLLGGTGRSIGRDAGLSAQQMDVEIAEGRYHLDTRPSYDATKRVIKACLDLSQIVADVVNGRR